MATIRGSRMGWNAGVDDFNLGIARDKAHTAWVRFFEEIPWHLSSPDNVSNAGTLDLTTWTSRLALCRKYGQRAVVIVGGVPRQCNANAGSADAEAAANNGGGQWHWFPNTSGGRTLFSSYCVAIAGLLDPDLDVMEIGSTELNIHDFNHGDQSAAEVGAAIAAAILAVRAAHPLVKVMPGGIANNGNIYNPADNTWTGPIFGKALAAVLVAAGALPQYWSYHPYTNDGGLTAYNLNDPLSSNGWGVYQMAATYDALIAAGVTNPKIWVTEYGEPSGGAPEFSPIYSVKHSVDYTTIFNAYETLGILDPNGARIRYSLLQGNGSSIVSFYGAWNADGSEVPGVSAYFANLALEVLIPDPPVLSPPNQTQHTFTPPLRSQIPNTDIDPVQRQRNPNGNNLMRHFAAPMQAVNVWVLADGTITEIQPTGDAYLARRREYLGGHTYVITQAEADALRAAGYTIDGKQRARYDSGDRYDHGVFYG